MILYIAAGYIQYGCSGESACQDNLVLIDIYNKIKMNYNSIYCLRKYK